MGLLHDMCVAGATDPRRFQTARNMYINAVILDAITKSFFSEVSPFREATVGEDGSVQFTPFRFEQPMLRHVVNHFVDNEEIVLYVANMRQNELVSKFRHSIYRLLFTKMVLGASFDENQLAAWVRYAAYMERAVTTKRNVPPTFTEYQSTDLRVLYCYGSKLEEMGTDGADPFVKMRPIPPELAPPVAQTPPTPRPADFESPGGPVPPTDYELAARQAAAAARSIHPAQVETTTPRSGVASRQVQTTLSMHTRAQRLRILYNGRVLNWDDNVREDMRHLVPEEPPMVGCSWNGVELLQTPDGMLDPNYIKCSYDSYAKLVQALAREINSDPSVASTISEAAVKDALERLGSNIRTHPLRKIPAYELDPQGRPNPNARRHLHLYEWAAMFLPENLEAEPQNMAPILRMYSDPAKTTEQVYFNVALLCMSYERMRLQFLRLYSHEHTRERAVTLGPTLNCTVEPMEVYQLRRAPGVVIRVANPNFQSDAITEPVLTQLIGMQRAAREGLTGSPDLAAIASSIGSSEPVLVIDDDIERVTSRDYRRLHNIPEDYLPATFERRIRDFYRRQRPTHGRQAADFDYQLAVQRALVQRERDKLRHTPQHRPLENYPIPPSPRRPAAVGRSARGGSTPARTPDIGADFLNAPMDPALDM